MHESLIKDDKSCLSNPVGPARLTGENVKFSFIFLITQGLNCPLGRQPNPPGDDMKI